MRLLYRYVVLFKDGRGERHTVLELRGIKKTYKIGEIETKALDDVTLSFREKEFVAILGMSGSGKTTCLNIIGGLDRYDSGEMLIKGKITQNFKDKDWDAYRNNSVGFVFQNYNLIMHLGIVANVEISMSLSGVSAAEKRKRAIEVLERVGLKEHLHKKPNQLSGGQMQRVAIARALVNNPEILLCDEPTGALDTHTSEQIMDLIKELSKDRLVIMVTHNPEIAETYADRIINFKDGKIIQDTNEYSVNNSENIFSLKKTSMSFVTALKLSANNLRTKKGRAFLTAFASSIGIIGIATIIALSSGFQVKVDDFQRDALSEFPIIITRNSVETDRYALEGSKEGRDLRGLGNPDNTDTSKVYTYDPQAWRVTHTNLFTEDFMTYLESIDPEICSDIGRIRLVSLNMLRKVDDQVKSVGVSGFISSLSSSSFGPGSMLSGMSEMGLSSYPISTKKDAESYIEKYYDLLSGEYPTDVTDIVLIIDGKNCVDFRILESMGFDTTGIDGLAFSDIVGTELKLIPNNNLFTKTQLGNFMPNMNLESVYEMKDNITIKICGIVTEKEDIKIGILSTGFAYSDALSQLVIDMAVDSDIVKAQMDSIVNVITMQPIEENEKEGFLSILGGDPRPQGIMLYPQDFKAKDSVTEYLDAYNEGKEAEDRIIYTDLAATISGLTGNIMGAITLVLLAFAAISLVVSLIMISIITYTSVIERTKEIGILKALGARKKDITRVFDAETCILGIMSGLIGVLTAYALTFPANALIYKATDLKNVAQLQFHYAIMLVALSTILTMIGGHIPAKMASKKDAVEALRSE